MLPRKKPRPRFRAGEPGHGQQLGYRVGFAGRGYVTGENTTNVVVTEESSLCLPALYACVASIAKDLAALPFRPVQIMEDGTRREATEHPTYELLMRSPDGNAPANRFLQTTLLHALVWGNAYWEVVKDWSGRIVSIELRDPRSVVPMYDGPTLFYTLGGVQVPREKLVHVASLSPDGVRGYSPVLLARQAVALGLAGERFAGSYISKGLQSSAILETPPEMTSDARETLQRDFLAMTTGDRAFGVAVLPGGVKANPWTTNPLNAQLLESRRHQVLEICRIFQVPPHKAMHFEHAAYSTIEASNLEYAGNCLGPWAAVVQSAVDLRLLTRAEYLAGYRIEYDFRELFKGDLKTRATWWKAMVELQVVNPNLVAVAEGYPTHVGGEVYLAPLNKTSNPGGSAVELPSPPKDE